MKKSKIIALYLKGRNKPQSLIKDITGISTTNYHDICKGKEDFTQKQLAKLEVIFPELKQIKGEENE